MGTGALFGLFCLASAEAAILIFLASPRYLHARCMPGGWGQPGRGGRASRGPTRGSFLGRTSCGVDEGLMAEGRERESPPPGKCPA